MNRRALRGRSRSFRGLVMGLMGIATLGATAWAGDGFEALRHAMVEQQIGTPVKEVSYKNTSWLEGMAAADPEHRTLVMSIQHAMETVWRGETSASTTSKEILEIAARG